MQAVIMAGGEGARLRPLTCGRPKPMVPIMGTPVMKHIIDLLKRHGITDIAVTLQYMPSAVTDYFGDGSDFGVSLTYYIESAPLGTAGSVRNARSFLNDDFLIISGDAVTDMDISKLLEYHNKKKALATIALKKVEEPMEYGVVITSPEGRIMRFLEKPDMSEAFSDFANTGIYILSPTVLDTYNEGEFYDFAKDLFPKLLKSGAALYGYEAEEYWCDIGDVNSYIQCHYDIMDGKVAVASGENHRPDNADRYSFIGDGCKIHPLASVKRSILWDNVTIGANAQVRGAVLCDKSTINEYSSVYEGTVVGMSTIVGTNSSLAPNIKIWPHKNIEDNTRVNANLVWGGRAGGRLFTSRGIRGEINVDITPEYVTKLGSAFGAFLDSGKVGVGFEAHPSGDMLALSFIAGLLSSGVQVYNFGEQILPITRSAVRFYGLDGGIHISVGRNEGDPTISMEFLDEYGANLIRDKERKIESLFMREDFVRAESQDIKELMELRNYKYYYLRDIINSLESMSFTTNMELQTKSETVSELVGIVLNEIKGRIAPKLSKKHFTAVVSQNGENIILHDKNGNKLSNEQYLALCVYITLKNNLGGTVVIPISASGGIIELADTYGGKVVFSKTSDADFMSEMLRMGCMEQFKLCYDGIYAAVKILDFLNVNNMELDDILRKIPNMCKREVEVPCENMYKSSVIKKLIDEYKDEKIEVTEGVKIFRNGGWTLVIPHNHKSVCRIITDAKDMETAEEMSAFFEKAVKKLAKSK